MGYSMAFRGEYTYADAKQLEAALGDVREMVDDTFDTDSRLFRDMFVQDWERVLRRNGLTLVVDVSTYGPPFLYESFESVVELLADAAVEGNVDGKLEGTDEARPYPAGRLD